MARIIQATKREIPSLVELMRKLAGYERLNPPNEEAVERLSGDLGKRFDAYLANIDGRDVGYSILMEKYSSFEAMPVLYLHDLFVLEEYRDKGIGRELFAHALSEAKARNCCRMEWEVLRDNELAIRFYERRGATRLDNWIQYRLDRDDLEQLTI